MYLHHLLGVRVHPLHGSDSGGSLGGEGLQVARGILIEASTIGGHACHRVWHAEIIEAACGLGVHWPGHGAKALLRHECLPSLSVTVHGHIGMTCRIAPRAYMYTHQPHHDISM